MNCTKTRGNTYDDTKSTSWNSKGLFQLGFEVNLGYQGNEYNGTFGYDTLGIQSKGANVSVDHQVVAAIENKGFYLGNLGLSPYNINFTSGADSSPSLLTSLKSQNLIPSLSYGYTAGASYRKSPDATSKLSVANMNQNKRTAPPVA